MNKRQPRTRGLHFARIPRSAGLALALAVMLFAGGYAAGQDVPRTTSSELLSLERQAMPVAGGVGIVTPAMVLAGQDADAASIQLVDVRTREAFELAHATGALSMPESEMVGMAATLPSDRTLVLYCTCPDEKTSLRAARTLAGVFHVPHVVVLKGGLDAYAEAGGAVTSAAADSALETQGCGCSINAPAHKLRAIILAEQRAQEQ